MLDSIVWDEDLIAKYNRNGPRYTSYPTALEFSEGAQLKHLHHMVNQSDRHNLSLYIHIPFCHKLCYYCGCNKIITRHQHKADIYLDHLEREIEAKSKLFQAYKVTQLHLGGGTPTFLTDNQMQRLINLCKSAFDFSDNPEMSIEIDPREIELLTLNHLVANGFNRLSIGVQDFNQQVQIAVNRVQDEDHIRALIQHARQLGIQSINLDLIYGLPYQSESSFMKTLDDIVDLDPDRLSIFNYAHLPSRFAAQRKIPEDKLPGAKEKLAILRSTINHLVEKGYQYIGMDHFAKPDDELAKLQRTGQLHRNFQGYTTQEEVDLLGLGASSISQIGNGYLQNYKDLKDYYPSVIQDNCGLHKSLEMDQDDLIRAYIIKKLICNLSLDIQALEQKFNIRFENYFADAMPALADMQKDGLVSLTQQGIVVRDKGRMLIRQICMLFDAYLVTKSEQKFSKAI